MSKIIVIGSSNVDLTAMVTSLPLPGETVGGARLVQANGGKGANQAVAAARLGGDVTFLSCVGDDAYGNMLKQNFNEDGIDTSRIKISKEQPTGVALIYVDATAENCIAVAPGANDDLLPEDIISVRSLFEQADFLLIQLEIPMKTVETAVKIAKECGVKVIVNPAPMALLSDELLNDLWLITPNETEASKLTGFQIRNAEDASQAADALFKKGVQNVIITLGSNGSLVCDGQCKMIVPARTVEAVDTVGAGDVYNGALVASLSEGRNLMDAAKFATVASSISVTRSGAQTSVPYRKEVEQLMN